MAANQEAERSAPLDPRVEAALRRQSEDPLEHDLGLIEECLTLTPDQRLQRLTAWVDFVSAARIAPSFPE